MQYENEMTIQFKAISENEAFARVVAATFISQLNPTVSDITDIKTAVSEAVTNAIIHGYENKEGIVTLFCGYIEDKVSIIVTDKGKGIKDIEQARQPLYTSKPELERSGMGFTVMETFMDDMIIESVEGVGTKITMTKIVNQNTFL
ncbi:anti-sigma F factor [Clostridium sp. MD294]|uniref:anti-sigma F factor n=1 Tax=Clostridium sp. MD294 TaxID=97138 RepID=UPI0002CAB5AB|nr:anti-sigma F factor [Clostridium sp. MD294]NDO45636.1 anti-sigma F factor [Clostridium sp. MD294]USF30709.1 Anti-sigma F factor [Clostridium sp. MD294]